MSKALYDFYKFAQNMSTYLTFRLFLRIAHVENGRDFHCKLGESPENLLTYLVWLMKLWARDSPYEGLWKENTLLCEVTVDSICKCFVFFHPHLRIKSKASAWYQCLYIKHFRIKSKTSTYRHLLYNVEWNLVDDKALDNRFYTRVHMEKKPFAYRVPIGDYNY